MRPGHPTRPMPPLLPMLYVECRIGLACRAAVPSSFFLLLSVSYQFPQCREVLFPWRSRVVQMQSDHRNLGAKLRYLPCAHYLGVGTNLEEL